MKSLQESLFDNDLVSKEIPDFRSIYKLDRIENVSDIQLGTDSQFFDAIDNYYINPGILKKFKPTKDDINTIKKLTGGDYKKIAAVLTYIYEIPDNVWKEHSSYGVNCKGMQDYIENLVSYGTYPQGCYAFVKSFWDPKRTIKIEIALMINRNLYRRKKIEFVFVKR